MAIDRGTSDWDGQFRAAVTSAKARQIRHRRGLDTETCTMCNELCAIRLAKEAMNMVKNGTA